MQEKNRLWGSDPLRGGKGQRWLKLASFTLRVGMGSEARRCGNDDAACGLFSHLAFEHVCEQISAVDAPSTGRPVCGAVVFSVV